MALGTIYTQQTLLKALKIPGQADSTLPQCQPHSEPDRRQTESSPRQPRPGEGTSTG